jgi:hypothetical protein
MSASAIDPIAATWLAIATSIRRSNWRAMAPAATRAAVSRALARSRTFRRSSCPYFTAPARSAWPGRGRVTGARSGPGAVAADAVSTAIVRCQFSQSLFETRSAIGAPVVTP